LTGSRYFIVLHHTTSGNAYIFNGTTVSIQNIGTSLPFQINRANIYTIVGAYDNSYVAKNGTDWYFCNPGTLSAEELVVFDPKYTVYKPFANSASNAVMYFWHALDTDTGKYVILRTSTEAVLGSPIVPFSSVTFGQRDGFICGNIFIDHSRTGEGGTGMKALYLDNIDFPNSSTRYLVLQRRASDFTIIQESSKPIRIDISNSSPFLPYWIWKILLYLTTCLPRLIHK
jgi:hypothetical protein